MSTNTTNLNLIKPDLNETADIQVINNNMDIVDTEMNKKISHSLATAANDFLVSSGVGVFVKKTLAEIKTLLGLGSAAYTASTAYATAAQGNKADNAATQVELDTHLSDYTLQVPFAVTTGSANTYVATLNPAPASLVAGLAVCAKINVANTGASTLNVNGLGAKSILDSKGNIMASGKLRLNGVYTLRYDGTNFILQGEGGEYGTAVASDVLAGKTVCIDTGLVAGTIASKAAATITPSATAQTIAAGQYLSGAQTISAVTVPIANVLTGTAIAGQAGTMPNNGSIGYNPSTVYQAIPAGYTSGGGINPVTGTATVADVASGKTFNSASGVGLAGTNTNKRWASGTVTSSAANASFRYLDYNATSKYPSITVSGLSFQPSLIIAKSATTSNCTVISYDNFGFDLSPLAVKLANYNYSIFTVETVHFMPDQLDAYVTLGGFRLPAHSDMNGYTYHWLAYE